MKGKPVAPNWPGFDDALLQGVSSAFLRRRKAIAYQRGLACERDFSESATEVVECIHLIAAHLRLVVWANGGLWVGVFVRAAGRNAGWAFRDSFYGNMLDVSAETLLAMFEATLSICYWPEEECKRERLRALWARVHPCSG